MKPPTHDHLGLDETRIFLQIQEYHMMETIPVRRPKSMAVIIETAAINHTLRRHCSFISAQIYLTDKVL